MYKIVSAENTTNLSMLSFYEARDGYDYRGGVIEDVDGLPDGVPYETNNFYQVMERRANHGTIDG